MNIVIWYAVKTGYTADVGYQSELTIDREAQETPESYQRFLDRWIPLEETYFASFNPKEKADLYLVTGFDTR